MNAVFMGVIVPLSILLPIFIGIYRYRSLPVYAKFVLLYLVVSGVINNTATVMAKVYHANNLPLTHLLAVMEFLIFALFYGRLLYKEKPALTFQLLPLFFFIACVANTLFFQNIFTFNSYSRSLGALIIMLLAINYFAKIAATQPEQNVTAMPSFWFNTAIFLYYSGGFMLFIFSNFMLRESRSNFDLIWNIHAALVLLMYILFTIGFIKCNK
jgi:VanZ family protein